MVDAFNLAKLTLRAKQTRVVFLILDLSFARFCTYFGESVFRKKHKGGQALRTILQGKTLFAACLAW